MNASDNSRKLARVLRERGFDAVARGETAWARVTGAPTMDEINQQIARAWTLIQAVNERFAGDSLGNYVPPPPTRHDGTLDCDAGAIALMMLGVVL